MSVSSWLLDEHVSLLSVYVHERACLRCYFKLLEGLSLVLLLLFPLLHLGRAEPLDVHLPHWNVPCLVCFLDLLEIEAFQLLRWRLTRIEILFLISGWSWPANEARELVLTVVYLTYTLDLLLLLSLLLHRLLLGSVQYGIGWIKILFALSESCWRGRSRRILLWIAQYQGLIASVELVNSVDIGVHLGEALTDTLIAHQTLDWAVRVSSAGGI